MPDIKSRSALLHLWTFTSFRVQHVLSGEGLKACGTEGTITGWNFLFSRNLAVSEAINVRLKCQRCWHLSSKENGNAITFTNWNRSPKLWFSRETHLAVRPLMRSRSGSSDALWLIRCFEEHTTMFDCETVFIVFFSKALIPFEKT